MARVLARKHMPVRLRIAKSDQHLAVYLHDLLPPGLNGWILRKYYYGKEDAILMDLDLRKVQVDVVIEN